MKAIAFFLSGFAIVWMANAVFSLVKSCGVKFRLRDILEGALVGLVIVVAIIALTAIFGKVDEPNYTECETAYYEEYTPTYPQSI